ncbi:hypothetical protein [Nonomuraea sp. 10N515B]
MPPWPRAGENPWLAVKMALTHQTVRLGGPDGARLRLHTLPRVES